MPLERATPPAPDGIDGTLGHFAGRALSLDNVNAMDPCGARRRFLEPVRQHWPTERVWEALPFATTTLRQTFEDEVLAASPEDQEVLIAGYTDVVDLLLATTSPALGKHDDAEAAELRDLSEANRATFGHPLAMCVEHLHGQLTAQDWPRTAGSDNCEARTAVGEVIDIADKRFSTMIANPIRSTWAHKFEQLN